MMNYFIHFRGCSDEELYSNDNENFIREDESDNTPDLDDDVHCSKLLFYICILIQ